MLSENLVPAVGYIRVSTEEQARDGYGLDAQRAHVAAYCSREGLRLLGVYADEGVSGAKLSRPALDRLLRDAATGTFSVVVVPKLDRLARDLFAQLWVEKELLKHGVRLLSVSEPVNGQDPSTVLLRQIVGAFAEFERARISERMAAGRIQKAAKGGYAGGQPPTGYRARRGAKTLAIDPASASLVRRVFQLRDSGLSLHAIARTLSNEGFKGPKGGTIHAMQVKRILDREPFYRGLYRYAGLSSQGSHNPILEA